jgi:hypothetical protein
VESFYPLSEPISPQRPSKEHQYVVVDPGPVSSTGTLTWQIEVELLNGPWLLLGQSLPLRIKIKKFYGENSRICLHDFQTLLIETTQVHARGSIEIFKRSWIIQTMANIE